MNPDGKPCWEGVHGRLARGQGLGPLSRAFLQQLASEISVNCHGL